MSMFELLIWFAAALVLGWVAGRALLRCTEKASPPDEATRAPYKLEPPAKNADPS